MAATVAWVVIHGLAGIAVGDVARVVAAVDVRHLGLLAVIWATGLVLHAVVMSSALPGLGARRTLTVNLAGSAIANTVPLGGALAAALNWRMLSGWGHSNAAFVAYSTVTNGLAVLTKLALPVVAVAGLLAASQHVPIALWTAAIACAAALMLVGVLGVWLSRRSPGSPAPRLRWRRRVTAFFAGSGEQVVQIVRRRWVLLVSGSVAYTAAQVVLLGVCLHAVGLEVPLSVLVAAAAIERLGTVIPVTPGGAGVAEAGTIAWLIAMGFDPTTAVAGVVLYRVFVVVMEIPVGAAALAGWAWFNHGDRATRMGRPACALPM
jgi:uncharacterized membrane protein YbhN (UPF0104 family)